MNDDPGQQPAIPEAPALPQADTAQPQYQSPAQPIYPPRQTVPPVQPWQQPPPATMANNQPSTESDKEYVLAVIFSYLLGNFGVDRFYLGYTTSGIFKILTLGGLGIWSFVDLIRIVFGKMRDRQGRQLKGYQENSKIVKIIFSILLGIQLLVIPGIIFLVIFSAVPSIQSKARDTGRKTDISSIQANVEAYFSEKGSYPSATQMIDQTFREQTLHAAPTTLSFDSISPENSVSYNVTPGNCDAIQVKCTTYTLSTKLENGQSYSRSNLDQ
jgi:TM2 domain-containing membrane protein YozV/competence protein ComGC